MYRFIITLLLLFTTLFIANAQEFKFGDTHPFDALIGIDGTTDSTKIISLNGEWNIFGGSTPATLRVPFSYNGTDPVKISRIFRVPSRLANYQFRLIFLGIGQDASVTLNGEFLALGRGADAMFIDIPPNQLRYDTDNTLSIELQAEVSRSDEFPLPAGFYTPKRYSGIFRDAYLLALPLRRIESYSVNTVAGTGGGRLQLTYLIRDSKPLPSYALPAGTPTQLQLRWTLTPFSSDELIASNSIDIELPQRSIKQGTATYTVPNVLSWSPVQPNLYRLNLRLYDQEQLLHEITEYVGFRDIEVTPSGFFTHSGQPIKIVAANYVEEFPETGWSATPFQLERDIFAAKSLGLNTLRIIGKLPHPYLIHLADRYGLYLLVETPVSLPPARILRGEEFRQYIVSILRQFADHSGNHPSILGVSPGFGLPTDDLDEEYADIFQKIRHETGHLVFLSTPKPLTTRIADFQIWERLPGLTAQNLTLPEGASPLLAGTIGILLDPLTQKGNDAASELRQSLSLIKTLDQTAVHSCAGFVLGGLNDYQTQYPLLNRTPDESPYTLPVGVISYQRNERTTFVTLRDYLNGIPVKPTPVSDAPASSAATFIVSGLLVLLLFAFSVGQNKVLRMHVTRSLLHPGGFFTDVRDGRIFQFGETVIIGLLISLITATLGAATIFGLRHDYSFDVFLTTLIGNPIVKVWANLIIWNPAICIAFLLVFFTVIAGIFGIILSFVSIFTRQRIALTKAISYLTWGFANHLLLLPLSLILVGQLSAHSISIGWLVVAFFFLLWGLYRDITAILTAFRNSTRAATFLLIVVLAGSSIGVWYWLVKVKAIGMVWMSFRAAGW